jgi:penicillin-binding protein 2
LNSVFAKPYSSEPLAREKDNTAESELFFRRALVMVLVVFVGLLAVASRLVYLQVLNHERFTTLSDGNRIRVQPLPPTRGSIFDRNGEVLAENLASYHLEITREQSPDLDATLAELRQRIELTDADIERFRKMAHRTPGYIGVPLRFRLTDEEIARLAIDLYRFPGVEIKADLTRRYPLGSLGVHAVGYVGRIDENEMSRIDPGQYSGGTHIGKVGVERSYEDLLRGRTGWQQVETNANGRPLRVLSRTPPTPGQHIYLSIDMRLQAVAEKALEGYNGAIVAIDPRNGEILALASQPTYDPNPFVNGIAFAAYRELNTSKKKPLLNRALRGMYPPGSTIKPLMALAGLEYGVVNRHSGISCRGSYQLPGSSHRFRDWKRSGHGHVSMDRAIAQSCDVYFYDLALKLGIDRTHQLLDQFYLGRPTGVDLPGEKGGVLPSQDWKRQSYKQNWFLAIPSAPVSVRVIFWLRHCNWRIRLRRLPSAAFTSSRVSCTPLKILALVSRPWLSRDPCRRSRFAIRSSGRRSLPAWCRLSRVARPTKSGSALNTGSPAKPGLLRYSPWGKISAMTPGDWPDICWIMPCSSLSPRWKIRASP